MNRAARSHSAAAALLLALVTSIVAMAGAASAHEVRPAYLQIDQIGQGRFSVLWRTPLFSGMRLPVVLQFSDGIKQGLGSDRLRIGPIKMFIDGSLIGRTAAVTIPFENDPRDDNLGLTMMPKEQFEEYVMQAHTAG